MGSPDQDLARWMPRLVAVSRELLGSRGARGPSLDGQEIKRVGAAVQRLSLGLTRDRALVGERYMDDPALLAAYLLFYWPVSYAQVRRLLPELPGKLGPTLDLGSGPAPASFAALDAGAPRALAADRSPAALKLATKLAAAPPLPFGTCKWSPEAPLPDGKFTLIIAQHFLNEVRGAAGDRAAALAARAALSRALLGKLQPGGTLLLIEPALRDTSRDLLELRDVLVGEGFAVRAPCLYRGSCQALERPSDWCHAEREWVAPPLVVELARVAGFHKERLKMSYLALAPAGEAWADAPAGRVLRIVSEPLKGKGRARFMGCGPEGRKGLALQHKHVTDANRAFETMERGEVVRITAPKPRRWVGVGGRLDGGDDRASGRVGGGVVDLDPDLARADRAQWGPQWLPYGASPTGMGMVIRLSGGASGQL